MSKNDVSQTRDTTEPRTSAQKYEQPRVEKGRRLAEVTGQGAVVPSGAPAR